MNCLVPDTAEIAIIRTTSSYSDCRNFRDVYTIHDTAPRFDSAFERSAWKGREIRVYNNLTIRQSQPLPLEPIHQIVPERSRKLIEIIRNLTNDNIFNYINHSVKIIPRL